MNYRIINAPKLPVQILEINNGISNVKTEYIEPIVQAPSAEDAKAYLQNKYMNGELSGVLNSPDEWVAIEINN